MPYLWNWTSLPGDLCVSGEIEFREQDLDSRFALLLLVYYIFAFKLSQ